MKTLQTSAQAKWYDIRRNTPVAAAAKGEASSAEIFIFGDIGESWWDDSVTAADFVKEIAALDVDAITVRINSYGGSVTDGVAIYNAIKRHRATVTTVNESIAASIASLILMAGDKVEMAENAMMMIHAPSGLPAQSNSVEMRRYADMLDIWAKAMSTSYANKSGKPVAEELSLLTDGQDHWYSATDAQAAGYVDSIVDSVPVQSRLMASFDFKRFGSLPQTLRAALHSPVAAATNPKETFMITPSVNLAALSQAAASEEIQAAMARGAAAEVLRRQSIEASFAPHKDKPGVAELQARTLTDANCDVQAAGLQLLAHLGRSIEPVASGNVVTVQDEIDKFRISATAALLQRAGRASEADHVAASASPYRGMTLMEIARASLARSGINSQGMEPLRIVAQSFTQGTGDFPVILENAIRKELVSKYKLKALTWSQWCKRGSVSDFRAHNRYRVGSLGNLQPKNELGNYASMAIPDGEKSSITAATKGFIIQISREMIINDDMGAMLEMGSSAGMAAARTVESDVFAALLSNAGLGPVMNDGQTLFHAAHNNIATGVISVNTLDNMKNIMAVQKDPSSNDFLDLEPALWLGPVALEGDARVIVNSTYDPDASNKLQRANKAYNLVGQIVKSPRLTGAPFYLLCDPAEAAIMEVAFLNGQSEPFLDTDEAWTTDGTSMKVRLDYGVAGYDWRGGVRSTGA